MVFVNSPRRQRSVRAGLIAICVMAVGLLTAASAVSASPPASPGGSVSAPTGGSTVLVSSSGTYAIPVQWSASCPDTSGTQLQFWFWYVHIYVTRQDGSEANFQSVVYVGTEDSGTNNTQGMVVQMAPGLSTETFQVQVSLICGGQEQVIGSPSITLTKCDPDAYNRAQREYDTAAAFSKAGLSELHQADKAIEKFVKDYLSDSLEIIPEKFDALQVLKEISAHVAEVGEVGGVVVGLSITAEQLSLLKQDWSRLSRDAKADFDRARSWEDRANADLRTALASAGCPDRDHTQLNRLLSDQKRDDDARKLIDSWQNNGYLYVSPITHEVLTEAAALKQAKAALQGRHTAADTIARAATSSVKANAAQLRAAIRDIDSALRHDRIVLRDAARLQKATKTALTRLEAVGAT
jgi:hypothetical protein